MCFGFPAWLGLSACISVDLELPEDAAFAVGERVVTKAEVLEVRDQLSGYARGRFRGAEGLRNLVVSLVDAEVLAAEARAEGLEGDARVEWARLEEVARLYLAAELERRFEASVAASGALEAARRRAYDDHPEWFRIEEKRSAKGVVFERYDAAEAALERLARGEVTLESLGAVVETVPASRDDLAYPGFHAILFDARLAVGDVLPVPVLIGRGLCVGRVASIVAAGRRPIDDPEVEERLTAYLREERAKVDTKDLLAELAVRYPVTTRAGAGL